MPTPDHPYVLGYSLSQKVPDLKQVNPDATPDSTPKYFIPSDYQMTVTPGYIWNGAQRQDSKYTRGTLNFCLLAFRDDNDPNPIRKPEKTIIAQNANSGKLSQTLFDLTKTSENDGVMGFAQDLMLAKFFGPAASKCLPYQCDRCSEKAGLWLTDGVLIVIDVRDG